MGDYQPPFTITNEILAYVSSISEKVGRISATSNLEAKPQLRRNNKIKRPLWIYKTKNIAIYNRFR